MPAEELAHDAGELRRRLEVRDVAGTGELVVAYVADAFDERRPRLGTGLVVLAAQHEGRGGHAVETVDDGPADKRAGDRELAGPEHGAVDRRVVLHVREAVPQVLWPRIQPAYIPSVELVHRGQVLGAVRRAGPLVRGDEVLGLARHGAQQLVDALCE